MDCYIHCAGLYVLGLNPKERYQATVLVAARCGKSIFVPLGSPSVYQRKGCQELFFFKQIESKANVYRTRPRQEYISHADDEGDD